MGKSVLVACDTLVLAGGLLRFERFGKVIRAKGDTLAFVVLSDSTTYQWQPELPVLTMAEAAARQWDAVFVPGAGFPDSTIRSFRRFKSEQYGIRVQHILNDQSRRDRFLQVNRSFKPHLVVFNNRHWPVGTYDDFVAQRFDTLVGAVDTDLFRPTNLGPSIQADRWTIGGLINKNPEPLIAALLLLSDDYQLKLFGKDKHNIAERYRGLIENGKLEVAGPLFGSELAQFYGSVDCVVMTEKTAGWANLVAGAMASGVPTVCATHGTLDMAIDGETAIIVDPPVPGKIADNIKLLRNDTAYARTLADSARRNVANLNWISYSENLMKICGLVN